MKKRFALVAFIAQTLVTTAQTVSDNPQDSIPVKNLQEVVIEAPKVVRKADMEVYHPSKSAVENSKNGMQLLDNLMIPSLTVVDALNSITAAGQSVQLRINGRVSTIEQVRTLLPETVKMVEWIDNPGLRYNGANYVVNFIVTNPTVGGSLMTYGRQALSEKWGYYSGDAKFNIGRSQWAAGFSCRPTENIKTHRDYNETFRFPDGNSLTRTETPVDGSLDNTEGAGWISYNYIKPDTTVFYVVMQAYRNFSDRYTYRGRLSLSDGSEDIDLTDSHGSPGTTPGFSAYLEQHFAKRQTLVVDFGASLYRGHSYSDYVESVASIPRPVNDIHTYIRDRNQAYAVEADYIKNWNRSRLTAGASYSANRNRSEYVNLGGETFHQRQDKVYLFAEYFQRLGRWTATAGMGVQYNDFKFRESGKGRSTWSPRPQATVTYSPNGNHNFRLNFTSWQSSPSLSQTNEVPQQLDGFQWRVGNAALKTSSSYMLTLRYGFNLPRVSGSFGVRAFTSPDAITPLLKWESDRLVTTYENSDGLQNLSFWIAPQVEIIPDWLTLSGYIQYRAERMTGTGYRLYNHDWSGNVSFQVSHWGFVLSGQYQRAQRDLWGEKITWGEDVTIADLSYNMKKWRFSLGMLMPFGKYDQGSKMLSKWNRNEQHMRLDLRMPYVSISYNLQWGRQKRGADKLVNADASVDHSKAEGR